MRGFGIELDFISSVFSRQVLVDGLEIVSCHDAWDSAKSGMHWEYRSVALRKADMLMILLETPMCDVTEAIRNRDFVRVFGTSILDYVF